MSEENFRVQFLRGTTVQNQTFTGREGELSIDLGSKSIRVHDGLTAGGSELATKALTYSRTEVDGQLAQVYTKSEVDAIVAEVQAGSGAESTALTIQCDNWTAGSFTLPSGVTVSKEYSDSSIRITHNQAKYPTGWFAFSRDSSPFVGIVPTSTRNIQIIDLNEIIITNVSTYQAFTISLTF